MRKQYNRNYKSLYNLQPLIIGNVADGLCALYIYCTTDRICVRAITANITIGLFEQHHHSITWVLLTKHGYAYLLSTFSHQILHFAGSLGKSNCNDYQL